MDIELTIVKNKAEMGKLAAQIILGRLKVNPKLNLLVPTGLTPLKLYRELSKHPTAFTKASFFNFDEYGIVHHGKFKFIPKNHPASYRRYMHDHLFSKIKTTSYFPTEENAVTPGVFDQFIAMKGGVDICVTAIGQDGHTFGFNSPPADFHSVTRMVELNEHTRAVNKGLTGLETPTHAITTGMKTGFLAKEIIVLVSERRKAEILKKILESSITPRLPATILRKHQKCHWIIDEEAASLIR